MSSLEQIKESLVALEAYKLPERYETLGGEFSDSNLNAQPLLDPQTIQRFQTARAKYLKSQITSLIIEHLDNIHYESSGEDCDNKVRPIVDFPESLTEEQKKDLQQRIQTARNNLFQSVHQVKQSYEMVYQKYQVLQQKKSELENIVSSMEKQNQNSASTSEGSQDMLANAMDIDDDDCMVDQTELELQNEKIQSLLEKKSELEAKLRKVRLETEKVEIHCS
jgi:hypothetical protein